ncbi:MAG TPA: pyridoxal-phosphate dependent enzyme [Candidatus Dormibacteraeota bacterium]|nr:pyridoxal-phosphate dependent enzyme [Candidatus Dormibacteraeota bacterium]
MSTLPTIDTARAARERIAPYVRRTPTYAHEGVAYKLELLQVTGSFKVRGAFNAALQLDPLTRARGVVAVSGGNHGLAVAHVGRVLGIPATVIMPETTPARTVERARADGADVILVPTIAEAFAMADERQAAGQSTIHPYDDTFVLAGQGTIGFELLEDVPDLATLIVSIGGGGLISGIAAVVKELRPSVRIYGVETEGADAMRRALDAGAPVTMPAITSIAKTLGAPYVAQTTFAAAQRLLEDVVVVSDARAVEAMVAMQDALHVLPEPAASCCYAALSAGLIPLDRPGDGTTAILVCGGNVSLSDLAAWRVEMAV